MAVTSPPLKRPELAWQRWPKRGTLRDLTRRARAGRAPAILVPGAARNLRRAFSTFEFNQGVARLRYNNLSATLGSALLSGDTTITFVAALTHDNGVAVPTLTGTDYIPLTIEPGTANFEVVSLTAYTAAATTGTITRGVEGSAAAHATSVSVIHAPTALDFVATTGRRLFDVPPASASTWDDEFEGAPSSALDPKWTIPCTSAAGCGVTAVICGGSVVLTAVAGATHGIGMRQASPSGNFTITARMIDLGPTTDDVRYGIYAGIAGGVGFTSGGSRQSGPSFNAIGITTISDTADWSGWNGFEVQTGGFIDRSPMWSKLVWNGSVLTPSFSMDGTHWTATGGTQALGSQPTEIGLVMFSNTAATVAWHSLLVDWFRVTTP